MATVHCTVNTLSGLPLSGPQLIGKAAPAESRARILLVEDQEGDAELIQALLERTPQHVGQVDRAERLESAIARVHEFRYDVILLDLNLPDSQGVETLRRLQEAGCSTPVVVLSGNDDLAISNCAVQQGAQDFLSKGMVCGDLLVRAISHASQRHSILAQATATSLSDELTGLYNRRGLATLSAPILKAARRLLTPLTLIYLDLDGLKPINDKLGHEMGDRALVETARVLEATFRDCDLLCRLGGDEFAVLAVGLDLDSSVELVQRLNSAVSSANAAAGRPYRLAMSSGLAAFEPERHLSLDELLKEADERMYEQKRQRRGKSDSRS